MRTRIWNNLANIRFKAFYCNHCSAFSGTFGRVYSFFLSFVSTGCIAAWAIWQQYPILWAIIVAIAQGLHVARPFIMFLKSEKEFLAMSFEYKHLYLSYERLWYDLENEVVTAERAEKKFYELRKKEIQIERTYQSTHTPEINFLMSKAQRDTDSELSLNFEIGDSK